MEVMISTEQEVDQIISRLCDKYLRIINILKQKIETMTEIEAKLSELLAEANETINELKAKQHQDAEPVVLAVTINDGLHSEMRIYAEGTLGIKELAKGIKDFVATNGIAKAIKILNRYYQ